MILDWRSQRYRGGNGYLSAGGYATTGAGMNPNTDTPAESVFGYAAWQSSNWAWWFFVVISVGSSYVL